MEVKCRAIGFDNQKCSENAPACYFDRNKGCKKNNPNFVRNPPPYNPNQGQYPPQYPQQNYGANPGQNPFAGQQQYKAPEPLY